MGFWEEEAIGEDEGRAIEEWLMSNDTDMAGKDIPITRYCLELN